MYCMFFFFQLLHEHLKVLFKSATSPSEFSERWHNYNVPPMHTTDMAAAKSGKHRGLRAEEGAAAGEGKWVTKSAQAEA